MAKNTEPTRLPMIHDPEFIIRLATKLMLSFSTKFKDRAPLPTDIPVIEEWINDAVLEETIVRWTNP